MEPTGIDVSCEVLGNLALSVGMNAMLGIARATSRMIVVMGFMDPKPIVASIVIGLRPTRLSRGMCGGGSAPPSAADYLPGLCPWFGLRPSDIWAKAAPGHSPKDGKHVYGGAEPPPHIRRRSR